MTYSKNIRYRVILSFLNCEAGIGKSKYLDDPLEIMKNLEGKTLVFFDTETTGLYQQIHQVTEIAAVATQAPEFSVVDKYERKIKLSDKTQARLKCEIDWKTKGQKFFGVEDCLKLQGYNPDDPALNVEIEALEGFYTFCEKHQPILIGQNPEFDLRMINGRLSKKVPNKGVWDTATFMKLHVIPALLALEKRQDQSAVTMLGFLRKTDPKTGEVKLTASLGPLLKSLGVDIKGWHGAVADVLSTIEALKKISEHIRAHADILSDDTYTQEHAKAFKSIYERKDKQKGQTKQYLEEQRKLGWA